MDKAYFITGTDTNVGKTWATVALMRYFKQQGKSVVGLKPVASGCIVENGRFVNPDALLLQENATIRLDYDYVNPCAYELPVSPHFAGKKNPVVLDKLADCFNVVKQMAQIILVEGAGGWYSPLNETQDNSDLAKLLGLPVVLVVAIKLGCINHARLTCEAIKYKSLTCTGWIAVCTDPAELFPEGTVNTLNQMLSVPLLATIPYTEVPDFDALARKFSFDYSKT